jgi:microcystin-dependent protein
MSQPYVGECRMGGWNFAPAGWAFCQGQLLPISENETLFNLIGTTYGGDGQSTFQLPDLRGRVPIHQGTGPGGVGFTVAQLGGIENVTLTVAQLASHSHPLLASSSNGNTNLLQNQVLAGNATQVYRVTSPNVSAAMNGNTIRPDGGNQPHNNLQPYLVINWVISLFGVYPSQ